MEAHTSGFRLAPARPPAVALNGMLASSQGLATRAGLRMLDRGGNAMDAALAAAAVLTVVEPMSTGIGGDVFAIVHRDGEPAGLDGAGPAPAAADALDDVAEIGPRSVDVPGAPGGWAALSARFGRLGLDACLADAVDAAQRGFAVGVHAARYWAESDRTPLEWLPAPRAADRVAFPDMAGTLRALAENGPDAVYRGRVGRAIAAHSWLSEDDLAGYAPRWVEPLEITHRGLRVFELPPPTQGVAALQALGLMEHLEGGLPGRVQAVRLALEDAFRYVRDGADVRFLLEPERLRSRAAERAGAAREPAGGTVYLCAVDGDRMAVSLIQSLYYGFGSGVLVPGTGIVLNNRTACFAVNGAVEPGRRPYHTIIPGMLLDGSSLVGPFGVMGGFIQAQAHVQFVTAALDAGLDPQAGLDHPRFRVEGELVHLEPGLWDAADELRAATGLEPVISDDVSEFGGGQAIFCRGDGLVGGSDARKDGYAAGI